MGKKFLKKCVILGVASCILTGCGNAIPELTEEEASLVATYAADAVLQFSSEKDSRLIDTEKERARREELEAKAAEVAARLKAEEEQKAEEQKTGEGQSGASGSGNAGSGNAGGSSESMQGPEGIAPFIGLDGFEVSYAGYEIADSYPPAGTNEWEPTIDATSGKNLLVVKLTVTNHSGAAAVADVLSESVMFHVDGETGTGETVGGSALMTMLLNDFAFAQDEIEAGGSREYVLMIQVDDAITEIRALSMYMKKGEESLTVRLL